MSETLKKFDLDAALREWPDVEKSEADWEDLTRRIEESVRSSVPAATVAFVSDENLLAAPLGQSPEDGHNSAALSSIARSEDKPMTMQDRERDRRSLQDLAKMAQMTPPPPSVKSPPSGVLQATEAKKDDSGIVDLAMAAQSDPQGAQRAQSTPLATSGLFDDEPASMQPGQLGPVSGALAQQPPSLPPVPASMPTPSVPMAVPSAPTSVAAPASTATPLSAQVAPTKKGGAGKVVALFTGLVVLSGAAAGGFLFLKHRANERAAALAAAAAKTAEPAAVTPPTTATTVAAADTATPAPAASADDALDPDALPSPSKGKVAMAPKAAPHTNAAPPAAKPEKKDDAKLTQKDLPKGPDAPEGDLAKAMGKAVGADGKPIEAKPAAGDTTQFAPGSVPQKPSQGAVIGALGAVLPQARNCIGPDDPISRAMVTFGSNGAVQSVTVSGGAVGKPAEGCIKGALSKAKVAPFAEPQFVAPVTIRH